jgi:hypothetical protein
MKTSRARSVPSGLTVVAMAACLCTTPAALFAQQKPKSTSSSSAPSKPAAAPAKPAPRVQASHPASPGAGTAPRIAPGRGPAMPAPHVPGRGPAVAPGAGPTGRGNPPSARHGAPSNPARPGGSVPPGGREFHGANGRHATLTHDGKLRDVRTRDMAIHHGPNGARTIVRERSGSVRVMSNRFGHGYIAHPYAYRGMAFVHRTYYVNGVAYGRFYRPYVWGGVPINVYAPAFYYPAAFYGWAYSPWAAPAVYSWGWASNPWYGYYGGWFAPYPAYAGPAYWLTDYMVSQTLMSAYQERASELANTQLNYAAPLTNDVKNQIAEEVRRQLALENAESSAGGAQNPPDPGSSGIARMLSDNQPHVFVVASPLDVSSGNGDCSVTEGDVLQLQGTVPADSPSANLVVLAAKGRECAKSSIVQVQIPDLQDMQNHMRETLDEGLGYLQKQQGQGGIPAAPSAARMAPQQTAFAAIAPPPDPNVKAELTQQNQEADLAERQILQEASGPSAEQGSNPSTPVGALAQPKKIEMGQSIDEVVAIMGQPKDVADLGSKKIYSYDNIKFTFVNGKLTGAQ